MTSMDWLRWIGIAVGMAVSGLLVYQARSALLPFIIALVISYLLSPAVSWLERRQIRRTIGVTVLFMGFLLANGILLLVVVPVLMDQFQLLVQKTPEYLDFLTTKVVPVVEDIIGVSMPGSVGELITALKEQPVPTELSTKGMASLGSVIGWTFSSAFSGIKVIVQMVVIPVFAFYLLLDLPKLMNALRQLIPPRFRESVSRVAGEIDRVMAGFVRGQLLICAILAVCYSLGLLIAGVPMWLLIGMFAGAISFIPYLGFIGGIVPAVVLAAIQYGDLKHPIGVIVAFSVVQAFESNLFTPAIVGDTVGLHPVAVMVALIVFGEWFGLLGMLVAVPVAAILKVLLTEAVEWYRSTDWYAGIPAPPSR